MFKWLYKKQKPAEIKPVDNGKTQAEENKKSEYVLVKTITIDNVTTKTGVHINTGSLYLYLFEKEDGERKIEYKITIPASSNLDGIPTYSEKVYPWLKGKDFADIPSYWDVVKERRPDEIEQMYKRYFHK